jgi:hypothetical protein
MFFIVKLLEKKRSLSNLTTIQLVATFFGTYRRLKKRYRQFVVDIGEAQIFYSNGVG